MKNQACGIGIYMITLTILENRKIYSYTNGNQDQLCRSSTLQPILRTHDELKGAISPRTVFGSWRIVCYFRGGC